MKTDSLKTTGKKAIIVNNELKRLYPKSKTILKFSNNWELLVAVSLSAQCTDKQVNIVTEKLFKKYKHLKDYVNATQTEFEKDIYSTGFYKNKTKNILNAAKTVQENFNEKVPSSMEELVKIPGVGRKTANVILGNAFGIVEGIAVDTHVIRLCHVYGLTKEISQKKIENALMKMIPKEDWFDFTNRAIAYGREYCPAQKHDHENCPIVKTYTENSLP